VDDSAIDFIPASDEPDDDGLDLWLRSWFQLVLAEPVPLRLLDLVEQLEAGAGI
jgi:hypothetical protein